MIHTVTDQKTCSDNDSVSTRLVSDARFTGVPPVSVFMQGEMSDETEHTLIDAFSTLYTPEDFDGNDFLTKTKILVRFVFTVKSIDSICIIQLL